MAEYPDDDPTSTGPAGPPTVHTDADRPGTVPATRRDPLLLVAGLVALAVAVLAVVGPGVLAAVDPRWVLAAAALVIGGAVLATTVRRRR